MTKQSLEGGKVLLQTVEQLKKKKKEQGATFGSSLLYIIHNKITRLFTMQVFYECRDPHAPTLPISLFKTNKKKNKNKQSGVYFLGKQSGFIPYILTSQL